MRKLAYGGLVVSLALLLITIVGGQAQFSFLAASVDPRIAFSVACVLVSVVMALFFGLWFLTERSHVNASIGGRGGSEVVNLQKLRSVNSRDRADAVKNLVNATRARTELRTYLVHNVLLPFMAWTTVLVALASLAFWITINA